MTEYPRAVFFDLDDTLLDGWSAMMASWQLVCHEVGESLGCDGDGLFMAIRREGSSFWKDEGAVAQWRLHLDEARVEVVKLALAALGQDPSHAREIAVEYGRRHSENLAMFDDAFETLDALRAAGFRTGLITNGATTPQRAKIERFGIEPYMDVIVVEGEFGLGKPERAVFEHAARSVAVEPHQAWHVGDNLYADVGGAKASGLHAVWIHRDRLQLREDLAVAPDRTVAHLAELRDALGL